MASTKLRQQLCQQLHDAYAANEAYKQLNSAMERKLVKPQQDYTVIRADCAFEQAGLGKVLHNFATAVIKGKLRLDSFFAQRLSTCSIKLIRLTVAAFRYPSLEMAFWSYRYKISRATVETWRGPVAALNDGDQRVS